MTDRLAHHYDLLERVHEAVRPATYVEIGVDTGLSLRFARPGTRVVGIDPALGDDLRERYPDAALHASTSDAFFAAHDLTAELGGPVDLAFIDGLHRFEAALADLVNVAEHCHDRSVVLIHDCLPTDEACASRQRSTIAWAGDVWKLAYALRAELPTLGLVTVEVAPTGMGLMTDVGRHAAKLRRSADDLSARYRDTDYAVFADDPAAAVGVVPGRWSTVAPLLADVR